MRTPEPIRTVSFIKLADGREAVFGTSDEAAFPAHPFTQAERREVGQRLAAAYLNELCRGRAEFSMEEGA